MTLFAVVDKNTPGLLQFGNRRRQRNRDGNRE
jgi:hypothetical protein